MRLSRRLPVLFLLLVVAIPMSAQESNSRFEAVECPVDVSQLRSAVDCGYVTVPENHQQPDGSTIRLGVARIHSWNAQPEADPVIFLQGGPGGAAVYPMLSQPGQLALLAPALARRDVIVFDQRGIGMSQPQLDCPGLFDIARRAVPAMDSEASGNESLAYFRDCYRRHQAAGIDLAAYTTGQSAADVALIVPALGYSEANLYAVSYGTRLALTVMRDYPEVLRSVVLNSAIPHNIDLAGEEAANMLHSMEMLFEYCAAQFWCRLAYPDLERVFYETVKHYDSNPLNLAVQHPSTGEILNTLVDGKALMNSLFFLLYTPEGIGTVPGFLYELEQGETSLLIKRLTDLLGNMQDMPVQGRDSQIMSLEVMCSDFDPFIRPETANQEVPAPFQKIGIFKSERFRLCKELALAPPDPLGDQPVSSQVPTLILAGRFDHVTPAVWGARTAETLPNSFFYTVENQSHLVRGVCVDSITKAFLDQPDVAPDGTCLADERPLQFLIVPAGTRPLISGVLLVMGLGLAGITSYAGLRAWRRPQIMWRHNLRISGWLPLAFSALTVGALLLVQQTGQGMEPLQRSRLIETIVPLAMAIQAAFLFAPDDEAPLELLLACPRPHPWLVLERLLVVVLGQGLIALVGALAVAAIEGADIGLALLRWIPSAALLTGFSLNASIRSRKAVFGVLSVGVIWFAMGVIGDAFLPDQFVFWPLNQLQPVLWPLHPYLQPGDLLPGDYILNRLFVLALGLHLIALALAYVRDSERLLLGRRALKPVR